MPRNSVHKKCLELPIDKGDSYIAPIYYVSGGTITFYYFIIMKILISMYLCSMIRVYNYLYNLSESRSSATDTAAAVSVLEDHYVDVPHIDVAVAMPIGAATGERM